MKMSFLVCRNFVNHKRAQRYASARLCVLRASFVFFVVKKWQSVPVYSRKVSNKLLVQEKNTKKKIYSLHEPEVCCIDKGKDHVRYEFGQQAAIVKTNSGNWIINVEDLPDNPYAGHTLALSIEGAEKITKVAVKEADVDKGYRGHDYKGTAVILSTRSNWRFFRNRCPLSLWERAGVRAFSAPNSPHPNPLPEGEGTIKRHCANVQFVPVYSILE